MHICFTQIGGELLILTQFFACLQIIFLFIVLLTGALLILVGIFLYVSAIDKHFNNICAQKLFELQIISAFVGKGCKKKKVNRKRKFGF